jgi:hypothetical protein
MEVAALKAKLKFIDLEHKTSANLEKIKTMKEIEMAHAKLKVLNSVEEEEDSLALKEIQNIPKLDVVDFTTQYVDMQSCSDKELNTLNPYASEFIPTDPSNGTMFPTFVFNPTWTQTSSTPSFAIQPPIIQAHTSSTPSFATQPPIIQAHTSSTPSFATQPPIIQAHTSSTPSFATQPPIIQAHTSSTPSFTTQPPIIQAHTSSTPSFATQPPIIQAHILRRHQVL